MLFYWYIGSPMNNNLALFITHHAFLTEDEIASLLSDGVVSCLGHCVPVWIDAKTSKTTEPAKEVFCTYELFGDGDGPGDVDLLDGRGYKIRLPKASSWSPPEVIDFDSMADWTTEMRQEFLAKRDSWWFNNPKPPDIGSLSHGNLRFDVKKQGLKVGRRIYSVQHVVQIQSLENLKKSLTG